MSEIIRTTRECTVNQLNPQLLRALEDYFQAHKLGDMAMQTLLCCETITERKHSSWLDAWLDGNPEGINYLGLILTEQWLLWVRSRERSATIVMGANLKEIQVKPYTSRLTGETGLKISGYFGDTKGRVEGNLALGPEPAAQKFCEQAQRAIEKFKPAGKKKN